MSRVIALIRFNKTGNIYYGCYSGTSDTMYLSFTEYDKDLNILNYCKEHNKESRDLYYSNRAKITDEDDIEIYSDYGGGFFWNGKGSEEYKIITRGIEPRDEYMDGMPDWVEDFMVNVMNIRRNYES